MLSPDNDTPGRDAMIGIARLLKDHCQIKWLDSSKQSTGWDIADALDDGWDSDRVANELPMIEVPYPIAAVTTVVKDVGKKGTTIDAQPVDDKILSRQDKWIRYDLERTGGNYSQPQANVVNAYKVISQDPALRDKFWYDEFLEKILTGDPPREWTDVDDTHIQMYIQSEIGIARIGSDHVSRAIIAYAQNRKRNCFVDWLKTLKWDGIPRIAQCFSDHFGADNTQYVQSASRNFFISLIARGCDPGCQVDTVVVLEGSQGTGKSSTLRIIGGPFFTEQHESATNPKAFCEVLQGKLLIEIAEMDSFTRSEVTRVKAVITNRNDRYRAPYERHSKDHPRRCVFVGTTNKDQWAQDETGGRRFVPVLCSGQIDLAAILAQREQFYAEAYAIFCRVAINATPEERVAAQADWWTMPERETKIEQEKRFEEDAWEETILEHIEYSRDFATGELKKRTELLDRLSTNEVMADVLKIPVEHRTRAEQMRIAKIFRHIGWKRTRIGKIWTYTPWNTPVHRFAPAVWPIQEVSE